MRLSIGIHKSEVISSMQHSIIANKNMIMRINICTKMKTNRVRTKFPHHIRAAKYHHYCVDTCTIERYRGNKSVQVVSRTWFELWNNYKTKKKRKYFCVFQIVKIEIFLLFSIWEEATKNEVENKRTRNKRKYFWSFWLWERRGKQRGNLFGFLINKNN